MRRVFTTAALVLSVSASALADVSELEKLQTALRSDTYAEVITEELVTRVVESPEVAEVLDGVVLELESIAVEPLAGMESSGVIITFNVFEDGLGLVPQIEEVGATTHPCFVTIFVSRPKYTELPYVVEANKICAMNSPNFDETL